MPYYTNVYNLFSESSDEIESMGDVERKEALSEHELHDRSSIYVQIINFEFYFTACNTHYHEINHE